MPGLQDQVPNRGCMGGNQKLMFLSLSFPHLPFSLKINEILKKKKPLGKLLSTIQMLNDTIIQLVPFALVLYDYGP